jgi:hypothetical protein
MDVAVVGSDPDPGLEEATPPCPGDVPDIAGAAPLGSEFADRDKEPPATSKTNERAYDNSCVRCLY